VTELPHLLDDRQQRLAVVRELVLDARGTFRVASAFHEALVLERTETLGKSARADPGARMLEL